MEYSWSLAYVLTVFALILVLSLKMALGYALFLGTTALGILFRMPFNAFAESIYRSAIHIRTVELVISIFLILILSQAMKSSGQMEKIVKMTIKILHDIRLATFFLPALIGLLPMPGGAYFSAPMVDSALKNTSMAPLKRTFANYWFRHVWEYINPIYPGIVAVVALTGLEFAAVVKTNLLLTLTAITVGALMVFLPGDDGFSQKGKEYKGSISGAGELFKGIAPVILVLIMVAVLNIDVIPALVMGVGLFLLLGKFSLTGILEVVRKALSLKMLFMLLGICFFQGVLNDSGAVNEIAIFLGDTGIGVAPVIFGISFLSGFVTGITIAFVGLSLAIVMPLLPEINPGNIMFVFAAGFGGGLLSPVHLCFVMSCQYFRTRLFAVYRYLIPAVIAVMAVGFMGYLFN